MEMGRVEHSNREGHFLSVYSRMTGKSSMESQGSKSADTIYQDIGTAIQV